MQQGWLTKTFKGDRALWGLVALFMVYSLLAVYSSSVNVAFRSYGGDTTYFLRSQFFMLLLGLVIIIIVHYLPYRIYFSLAGLFLIVATGLLVLTLFFGARINEATRWLEIPGTNFRLQTSDVAKVALVLYMARTLAKYQGELDNFILVTKYFILPVGIICGLIMPENLSTAVMIFGISIIILYIGRVPVRFLLAYIGLAVACVVLFALLLSAVTKDNRVEVWKDRMENFVTGRADEADDYQSNQAKDCHFNRRIIRKSTRKEYSKKHASSIQLRLHICNYYRGIRIIPGCNTSYSGIYDPDVQGDHYCQKMRNGIPGLSCAGTDGNDCGPGNDEYAGGSGIAARDRTDTPDGQLGENLRPDDEFFNRGDFKREQGSQCEDKEGRTARG